MQRATTSRLSVLLGLHVAVPLAVGTFVYLAWRPESLAVFGWVEAVGAADAVRGLREVAGGWAESVPEWVRYSLPNGLWVYAFTVHLAYTWREAESVMAWGWLCVPLTLGLGAEFAQAAGVITGTFDWTDVWVCLAAAGAAVPLIRRLRCGPGAGLGDQSAQVQQGKMI